MLWTLLFSTLGWLFTVLQYYHSCIHLLPLCQLFSGEDASCHLWFCASLLFICFVCLSFCVCAMPFLVLSIVWYHFFLLLPLWAPMVLWQGHCSQHCFSWHRLGPTPFWALKWRSCYRWLRQQNLFLIIISSAGFLS